MNDYFVDAMGVLFGTAFLPEGMVMDHPEDEHPDMARYRRLLAEHGIPHEAGRQFLLKVWSTLVPHLVGGIPYDRDDLVGDLLEESTAEFGQPLKEAVEIAVRVGLSTDYGVG